MKKRMLIVWMCICILGITGCGLKSQPVLGSQLLKEGKVTRIEVSSLPEGYAYSFSGKDATAIIDYLSGLNLEGNFKENPDQYGGMTWVISLHYEDRDTVTVYHFGNLFIRSDSSRWYKMTHEEASRFEALLNQNHN